jgi:Fe2+ transport system protein FeoA
MTFTNGARLYYDVSGSNDYDDRPYSIAQAKSDRTYRIVKLDTDDKEMKEFLFTLGCYPGEFVTVISKLADHVVVAIKDARYSIDSELARAIVIEG